jgi:hypothetical protein
MNTCRLTVVSREVFRWREEDAETRRRNDGITEGTEGTEIQGDEERRAWRVEREGRILPPRSAQGQADKGEGGAYLVIPSSARNLAEALAG